MNESENIGIFRIKMDQNGSHQAQCAISFSLAFNVFNL